MKKIVKIAAAASAVVLMTACAGCGTGGAPSEQAHKRLSQAVWKKQ